MLIPIRCISCGKPLAQSWEKFNSRVKEGEDAKKVLDELGITNYCCRALFLTHVDLVKTIAKFKR